MSAPFRLLEECGSTNDEAKRWAAEGAPHGAWIQAKRQTGGRGRLGRTWISAEGNLFLSVILRLPDFAHLTWVPLLGAASAVKAMEFEAPGLDFRIKWPNDIWTLQAKLGGVLCEGANGVVIVGIGLNLNQRPEGELLYPAASLAEQTGRTHNPEVIAARTAWNLAQGVHQLRSQGPAVLETFYNTHALFGVGTQVEWADQTGEVIGLGSSGELRVWVGSEERSLFAEDVSLRRV